MKKSLLNKLIHSLSTLLFSGGVLFADTMNKKDGGILKGRITDQSREEVKISIDGTTGPIKK